LKHDWGGIDFLEVSMNAINRFLLAGHPDSSRPAPDPVPVLSIYLDGCGAAGAKTMCRPPALN